MTIASIRPVLLSAPYAHEDNLEVRHHLPHGYRTTGLVEVRLSNGVTGIGEGYLAVFAPRVFEQIVHLVAPALTGLDASDLNGCYRTLCRVCDYWSYQGAARHVTSAVMIALVDAVSQSRGLPAWRLLNPDVQPRPFALYGSGGDSVNAAAMADEIDLLKQRGIRLFKIRARPGQAAKVLWVLKHAGEAGIEVGVDMTQNLARPSQSAEDVKAFIGEIHAASPHRLAFVEEVFGPEALEDLPRLREEVDVPVTGGEIVTTAEELLERMRRGYYDWVQPDATVVGGCGETFRLFELERSTGCRVVVHCWGAGVCMMANYHAAWAGGASLAEWPMPAYPLRDALMASPLRVEGGQLEPPEAPGLGVTLTPEVERAYAFREEAVYDCLPAQLTPYDASAWQD